MTRKQIEVSPEVNGREDGDGYIDNNVEKLGFERRERKIRVLAVMGEKRAYLSVGS